MLYTKLKHRVTEIKDLTKLGLIDPSVLRNIGIFEEFHSLRNQKVCVQCCYEFIADEHKISWETVKKIVEKMKKD